MLQECEKSTKIHGAGIPNILGPSTYYHKIGRKSYFVIEQSTIFCNMFSTSNSTVLTGYLLIQLKIVFWYNPDIQSQ